MELDYELLNHCALEHGPSFYIYHSEIMRANFKKISHAFRSRYQPFVIGYSYKTNYLPYLCMELDRLGAYAEVVSRLEYDLALRIGADPGKIIFNGPVKSADDIERALLNGSILHIDSLYEIDYVASCCRSHPDRDFKAGIRVNFGLPGKEGIELQEGLEVSRFGLCTSSGEFAEGAFRLRSIPNLKVAGLHAHYSIRDRSPAAYRAIAVELCRLAESFSDIEYLDIGGGMYGELPSSFHMDAPNFDDYAKAVCPILQEAYGTSEHKPQLIIEPGMALAANAFSFAAKVIETKAVQNQHIVVIDGSVHNVKPTMHTRNLPMKLVSRGSHNREAVYSIAGYTCMEKDYLARDIKGRLPMRGDFIVFQNTGAYTMVFNPPFIKERPAVLAESGGRLIPARYRERFEHFFNEEVYVF